MRLQVRGLTLLEGLVAAGLAVVLGVVVWQLLASGLRAHSKGQWSRQAQAGTRELVSLLVSELRSSSVPPLTAPTSSTPVFWPGAWGPSHEPGSFGTFYPRQEVDSEDRSVNRLLYVRVAQNASAEETHPLARYALVELLVPEQQPNRLERRVYALSELPSPLKVVEVQGADGGRRRAWVVDVAQLLERRPPEQPDILYDAGPGGRVAFRVAHRQFAPASDPGRTRNPELFDPGVFALEAVVALQPRDPSARSKPWPEAADWDIWRTERTELKIPSVRWN